MEISESAWAKAKEIAEAWRNAPIGEPLQEFIANAIDQERRECADIAEKFERSYCEARDAAELYAEFRQMNAGAYAAMDISQAIRNK